MLAPGFQLRRHKDLAGGLEASQDDSDQPADRRLGGQVASGGDGMEAVARELLRRNVIADLATGGTLGQQVPDKVAELLVGLGDMGASM
jgi:hypothetical protein